MSKKDRGEDIWENKCGVTQSLHHGTIVTIHGT